jgi:REP element-mobilizing transposase RayT
MECVLSRITYGKVVLTGIGNIAKRLWLEIPEHFKNVELDEFIIMPNHMHGIVIINNVETCHGMSLQKNSNVNKFSKPISGSLAMIINQYKSSVARICRKNGYNKFAWQPRFYDHIIRNEKLLQKIREYIHNNPLKWDVDENNPDFLEERRKNEVL